MNVSETTPGTVVPGRRDDRFKHQAEAGIGTAA